MTYRVRTTERAEADAKGIYRWIAEQEGRPLDAIRWIDGLEEATASLSELPFRCGPAPESSFIRRDVRQLLHHRHRALFVVEGDEVVILHVRHGSRMPATADELEE